jgi:hypothetical protein
MVLGYLALVEAGKRIFYRTAHLPHQRGSSPARAATYAAARPASAPAKGT